MPPLKKGDVRQALDKRIESSRKRQQRISADPNFNPDTNRGFAVAKGAEQALQNVRNELFGERLPKVKRS